MDIYHIWCDLKPGAGDTDFCAALDRYMVHLRERSAIRGHRITRRKLGLGPDRLGEFHIMVEVEDLAQLDQAFRHVGARSGEVEGLHHDVNSKVENLIFALYRDFPDEFRSHGDEKF
jgi:hypothetical protein